MSRWSAPDFPDIELRFSTPGNCITCRLMPPLPRLTQSLGHTCLPTRTCSFPTCQDVCGKANHNELSGVSRDGTTTLVYLCACQHFGTARCALVRSHRLSSC